MAEVRLTVGEIAAATGGRLLVGDAGVQVLTYHTDSREVAPGGLFFALPGASGDGHAYLTAAAGAGAAVAVVSRPDPGLELPQVVVEDTWQALFALTRHALDRIRPRVVGVTGSNGKTSTKELLAAALGARYRVHRTQGNLNTETGLPLTVLAMPPDTQALVLEMGLQKPGDIGLLARLARPEVGVITLIGSVHMEFFSSREELARHKGELVAELPPVGTAVLNAEDAFFPLLASLTPARVVTFGLESGDYRVESYRPTFAGCRFTVGKVTCELKLPGRIQAANAAAALAAAEALGVPTCEAAPRLSEVEVPGRLRRFTTAAGYTVIDDSYNASPESMTGVFEVVAEARPWLGAGARALAVLGEMRELGELAEAEHERVGRAARDIFDAVCVLDTGHGRQLAGAAGGTPVASVEAARAWLETEARPGDLVLVKASRGVRLDRLVAILEGGSA